MEKVTHFGRSIKKSYYRVTEGKNFRNGKDEETAAAVTFEETRTHLGMETQIHWSEKAIDRTIPDSWDSFP